ncbi:hypothetical protein EVAR_10927_1 [Eumeta japonica]|uniref:Uncharacterized protein n=1 Tax=Eumeta variegata TaxID=151549 RepID=A0A4C1U654_EUMVA|nr:hypothetical protein EVAR_10927_1 [Eumeta japonica]
MRNGRRHEKVEQFESVRESAPRSSHGPRRAIGRRCRPRARRSITDRPPVAFSTSVLVQLSILLPVPLRIMIPLSVPVLISKKSKIRGPCQRSTRAHMSIVYTIETVSSQIDKEVHGAEAHAHDARGATPSAFTSILFGVHRHCSVDFGTDRYALYMLMMAARRELDARAHRARCVLMTAQLGAAVRAGGEHSDLRASFAIT